MTELPTATMEEQHALVTAEQLRANGCAKEQISWLTASGRLVRLSPRVFRLAGAPVSEAQRALAAVLDTGPGAALSHTSALGWWQVPGFLLEDFHVTYQRRGGRGGRRSKRLAAHIHDVESLPEHHVRVLDGIPVVSPARALFDAAGLPRMNPDRIERAVDNAWSLRLVSGKTLHAMMRDQARKRKPGIALMRTILATRGENYVPPASGVEARVAQILRDACIAPLRRQVDTGDDEDWIGRVDFRDDTLPFVVEVQSERFHSSLLDRQADKERLARLDAAGFVVVAVTDVDVWHRPSKVVKLIRAGRWDARRRQASAARTRPPPTAQQQVA